MSENHKSFFDRLVFLSFEDRLDIELAYALGKYWFRSKYRKEVDAEGKQVRYFEHMRRAVLILVDELHIADPALIIALLLHDSLEDTREQDLAAAQIEKRFGKDVIWLVKMLSKCPKEGYLERLNAFADWRVLILKACDRLDNLRSLSAGSIDFQHKQIEETRNKYYPLFDKLVATAPKEHVTRATYLRNKIHEITENFPLPEKEKIRPVLAHCCKIIGRCVDCDGPACTEFSYTAFGTPQLLCCNCLDGLVDYND